ncbi:MAG TPA: hypothetical protein VLF18_08560 [Tahibacter sp.]|uniref:hypothetical protein n=1 Tax=Tahibacter sp. TaxID=2056211 RepID=UPI002C3C203A|nr:hypothetical protein [Tahibacter sp.]HSX60235.1 hypothetical protein [Tahibacter sp.]
MNPNNEAIRKALASATGALFELDDRGCTAACIVIKDGRARVLIAEPAAPLADAALFSPIDGGQPREVGTVQLAGCSIEWDISRGSKAA